MKKVIYLTTVDVNDKSAQSNQITEMCLAYKKIMNEDFISIAFSSNDTEKAAIFTKLLSTRKYKLLRSIVAIRYMLSKKYKNYSVITREIIFAFFFGFAGAKTILESHDKTSLLNRFLIFIMRSFPNVNIVTVTHALKRSKYIPFPKDRVYVFPNGVSSDYITLAKIAKYPFTLNQMKNAVYTGSLHKGSDIDSLSPLFGRYPEWNFIFVGGKDNYVSEYRQKYQEYSNVQFVGHVDKERVIAYQVYADVLLYPLTTSNSLWEYTSPLKLFEYMASSTPIIASNIGSVSEFLNSDVAFIYDDELNPIRAFEDYLKATDSVVDNKTIAAKRIVFEKYNRDERALSILKLCLS